MKAKQSGRKRHLDDDTMRSEYDFNREIELTRQNKQLMKLLESRARQKATISLDEVKQRLGIA